MQLARGNATTVSESSTSARMGRGAATPGFAPPARRRGVFSGLFSEVHWTAAYVGLLLYIFAIVTYRLPIATPAMVLAILGVFLGEAKVRVPPVLVVFGVFLVWGVIGFTDSVSPAVVQERLISLGKLWLIAFVVINALRTPAQIRLFLVFYLFCFATHPARGAIFNFVQGYTVFGRALWNHIYANPNDLAGLTMLPLGLAIALVKDRNMWVRRAAILSIVVLVALILMTQSRGAFVALALIGLLAWRTQQKKMRALAGIVLVAAASVIIAPSGVWERVAGLSAGSEADTSSRQRWEIWQVAVQIVRDNPVTGVGLGAYPVAHGRYTANDPRFELSRGNRDTHSTYLNLLAESGWPGLLLFLSMIGVTLTEAHRARQRSRNHPGHRAAIGAVVVALVGFLAAGLFASYAHLSFLYIHLALLAVLSRAAPDMRSVVSAHPRVQQGLRLRRIGMRGGLAREAT